jgi:hypothetical protein
MNEENKKTEDILGPGQLTQLLYGSPKKVSNTQLNGTTVPRPNKKPSKRKSLEGNILSLFNHKFTSFEENITEFVDLKISNVCLVDFPIIGKYFEEFN